MNKLLAWRYFFVLVALATAGTGAYLFVVLRPLVVEVAQRRPEVPVEVFGLGTVEARVLSQIGFEVRGTLIALNVDHGDAVKKGEVLARLHAAEQQARVVKARAGVVNAEAALKRVDAAVGKARAVLAQKRQSNQRKQALLAKGSLSVEDADEAHMQEAVADAELAVTLSEREVAAAALEDAKATYDYEKVLLEHHELKAPYDAMVVRRHRELGTVLQVGEPLFTLVDPRTVWVLSYVDESRAGDIRVGQSAQVRLRSLHGEVFRGQVVRIDIESDRVNEERRVYVACRHHLNNFHLGEQAEVFIRTAELSDALLIPETALESFDGLQGVVWTIEEGSLRRRAVEIGHSTLDAQLEIVKGLPPGALVVTKPHPGLREGRAAEARRTDV